jgi:hypothetical protein
MARTLTSTTFSAAVALTDKVVTLASTSGVEKNDILFSGKEAMLVNSISPVIAVQRGYAGTTPQTHASGKKAWHGQPGDFFSFKKQGTGTTDGELVLPRVVLPSGVIQTLVEGVWVDIQDDPPVAAPLPVYRYTEPGAIAIATGIHELGGDGADAMTLGTPVADDNGKTLEIHAIAAFAFTVTMTTADVGQGAGSDVITFGGAIGESVVLRVVNAKWHIVSLRTATAG